MTSPSDAPEISDEEKLARAVVSSSEAKLSGRGGVPASVFSYRGNFKISVDRFSRMTVVEAVGHGEAIAVQRGPNRSFYGWALLRKSDVVSAKCDCRAAPKEGNVWHANILMPESVVGDDELHEEFSAALARRSCWKDRSEA